MPRPAARLPIGRADCLIWPLSRGPTLSPPRTALSTRWAAGTLTVLQGGESELYDTDDSSAHVNNASLCTLFEASDFRYLSTGDAESAAEQRLVDRYGKALHATLFKAGHHGSSTSSTEVLLQVVQPQAVAISCGLNNDYGHPHARALQRLTDAGAEIYRTDTMGTITFTWQNDTLSAASADTLDAAA